MDRIRFKGNVITRSRVMVWVLISAVCFAFMAFLFISFINEILFQRFTSFTVVFQTIGLISGVVLSVSCGQIAINHLYGNKVEIRIGDSCLEVWNSGRIELRVEFKDIKYFFWTSTGNYLTRIEIKTDSTVLINVGSIWKGVCDLNMLVQLKVASETLARILDTKLMREVRKKTKGKRESCLYWIENPAYFSEIKSPQNQKNLLKRFFVTLFILLSTSLFIVFVVPINVR